MKKSFFTETSPDFENEFELELDDSTSSEFGDMEGELNSPDEEFDNIENEHEELEGEFEDADQEIQDLNNQYEYADDESTRWLDEYGSREQEYGGRIYGALSGEYESSFEMEQEIDRVLYEMEMDYFWKGAKKLWNKHKGKILGAAKGFLPTGTLQNLAKLAGGNLRSVLKSDLLKKGLTLAANAVAPGVGGAIAGGLLNNETPSDNDLQSQANQAVQIAKSAYQNMAGLVPSLRPGNIPAQISKFSRQAFSHAVNKHAAYKGKKKQVIPTTPGSIVVVRPDKIIIYS